MKKSLFNTCLLLLFSIIASAQNYSESIETFRNKYKANFLSEPKSPLKKKDLKHLRFYPPDSTYIIKATFERTANELPFEIPTYSGVMKEYVQYGILHFMLNNQHEKLAVYKSTMQPQITLFKDYLFLPFKDLTNGNESYGGGRYIDLKISEVDGGSYDLDFNKSYNPYCAYSSGYNCPIPPAINHLKIKIEAGEKTYGKDPKRQK